MSKFCGLDFLEKFLSKSEEPYYYSTTLTMTADGKVVYNLGKDGKPCKRSIHEFPYNYDPFVLWRDGENKTAKHWNNSLRLWRRSRKKYDTLCIKHFGSNGQWFDQRDPKKIQAFLAEYLNKPNLKLVYIMQHCNERNGYPYWTFHWGE